MLMQESVVHSFMEDAILPMIDENDENLAAELDEKHCKEEPWLRQKIRNYLNTLHCRGLMSARFNREEVRQLAEQLARDRAHGGWIPHDEAKAAHDWDQAVRRKSTRFGYILFSCDESKKTAHIDRIVADPGMGWGRRLMKGMAQTLRPFDIKIVTVCLKRQGNGSIWSFFRGFRFEGATPGTVEVAHLQASLDHPAFR